MSMSDARLPRLGIIKVGEMSGNRPKSLDYFRCTGSHSNLFHSTFGDKPKSLDIIFPVDSNIDDPYDQAGAIIHDYRCYKGPKRLWCRGDGKTKAMRSDYNTQKIIEVSCPCEKLDKECNEQLIASFMLLELEAIGVFQIWSKGFHTGSNFINQLRIVKSMAGTFTLIPMTMAVEMESSIGLDGKTKRYPVVNITAKASMPQLLSVKQEPHILLLPTIKPKEIAVGDLEKVTPTEELKQLIGSGHIIEQDMLDYFKTSSINKMYPNEIQQAVEQGRKNKSAKS